MLALVIADAKDFRTARIAAVLKQYAASEIIMLDDTLASIADLEQYLYPSLFTLSAPVVHARFTLESKEKDLGPALLKKLIASPTMFLFEEMALSKPFVTSLKKSGADVHAQEKAKAPAKDNLFAIVSDIIPIQNKKDRWLAYQAAIAHHSIEAMLGIMYWKIRDLALKERDSAGTYHMLYTALLEAHSRAWQEGTPLALAIEKVLLLY